MRPRAAVLDTNVLIYAYFEDAKEHERAKKTLNSLESWVIPFIVMVELFWFARGIGLGIKESRNLLMRYLIDNRVHLSPHSEEDLADSLVIEDPLDWEDELILLVAEKEGIPIATFDNKLRKKASERGIAIIP